MFKSLLSFLIPLLTISNLCLNAQQGSFISQDIGVPEEYTNPQVTSLYQDRRGLLWISTYGGMDRWDGHRMIHYPYVPFDSTGSPARDPRDFTCDDRNNIWFLGEGLMRLDLETEKFHHIPLIFNGENMVPRYVKYDPDGFLWVGANKGIFKYFPEMDSLQLIPFLGNDEFVESPFMKVSILKDSTGGIWMSHNQYGLCWFDPESNVFRTQSMDLPDFVDTHMNVGKMKQDPQGNFWLFGRKGELARFNPYSGEFRWEGLPVYGSVAPSSWGSHAIDQSGRIWYGTDRGLMLYDPHTKVIIPMDTVSELSYVIDMITDHHGNIILGTQEGAKVINPRETEIRTVDTHLEKLVEGASWHSNAVRDGDILWSGTFKAGLIRYNLVTGQLVNYRLEGRPGSNHHYVPVTLRDRSGRIWFAAGWDGALYRVNRDNISFERFQVGESHMITQCGEGFFWILGTDHVIRFDPLTLDTMRIIFKEPLPYEYLDGQLDLTPFIRDNEGIFWYAQVDDGLYRIDPVSREWTHYTYDKNNPNSLPDKHIKSIYCDSGGTIWLATWVGLSKVIKDPGNDSLLTFDNHFISDLKLGHANKITGDDHGNIIVGTVSGILVIRPDGTVERYSEKNGLPGNSSLIRGVDRDHENGNIYLGGSKVSIVPPGFLAPDTTHVATLLTEFRIGGKRVRPGEGSPLKRSILLADRIELQHDQNFFRIDFAATHLNHPEHNRYRYILTGIDKDTIYAGNQSYAEYTNLAPGRYTFWVSGASPRGPWDREGTSIEISIAPPWFRSQAAMSGYIVLMLLMILGYVQIRTRKLRKDKVILESIVADRTSEIQLKNERIVEMEALKTRFFTDISHEIRTPLSLITGPIDKLINEPQQSEKSFEWLTLIRRNSQRLLQLVNQLLDISRLDSGNMKLVLENSDVIKQIRVLANEYHSLAEQNHICYILDLPDTGLFMWNDRDKINKIITNLLSNAFKFTPEFGTITCRVKILTASPMTGEEQLRIIVADTGPGIHPNEHSKIFERFYRGEAVQSEVVSGTGIGLSLTRDLIKLLHGEIRVKSLLGTGTIFMVTFPLGKDHLEAEEYIIREAEKPAQQNINPDQNGEETGFEEDVGNRKQLVLIVEDDDELRTFIKDNLGQAYRTMEAEDGLRGWNAATSTIPDLIITDIKMPGMDGKELCEKLKHDERTSHIPLIMLTARASTYDRIEGLECGADDYIFKPFSFKEIKARITNLLAQREQLRRKYSSYIGLDWNEITVTTPDEQFLKKVTDAIARHLHDFKFDVQALQHLMAMSSSTLYKKIKALTGVSPTRLIRIMRLKLAAAMLEKNEQGITDILMSVGFSNPSYFTRCFRAFFGVTPREYQRSFK